MYLAGAAELWHTFAYLQPERRHQAIVVYLWNYLKAYHAYPREVAASFYLGREHLVRCWVTPDGQSGHRTLTKEEKIQLA
jgi:hypothetical protein